MSEVFAIIFAIATGYVTGGLIGSLHQLLTRRPASFQDIGESFVAKLWALAVIVVGGPVIIMRNAIRGRIIEQRPVQWLAMSTALATAWSFALGVCVLNLTLAI